MRGCVGCSKEHKKDTECQACTAKLTPSLLYREESADEITAIRSAVEDYYSSLNNREHGGVAAGKCLKEVQEILGMTWEDKR
ncbi:MAG: hypothetical protein KAS32_30965 [Candidatus Peribacteraceae bacterium]|nr:hypothetical protein [Candidatus Peribacteraceae bacterium]